MPNLRRFEQASQILGDVPGDVTQTDRMSEDTATPLFGAPRGVEKSLELDLFQHKQKLAWPDGGDRTCTKLGKNVALQQSSGVCSRVECQVALFHPKRQTAQPRPGHDLKRPQVRGTSFAAFNAGIDASGEQTARISVKVTRLGEADVGIAAERDHLLGMSKPVTESPQLGASSRDM